jgi:hypothetical protein
MHSLFQFSSGWGSVDAAERFLLERGCKYLTPVLLALLSKAMNAAKHHTTPRPQPQPDASAAAHPSGTAPALVKSAAPVKTSLADDDDDREGYRIRMTKYASGALAAITTSIFWLLLRVAHTARKPLRHFHFWVQKNTHNRMLFQLVTGKADQFMHEFMEVISQFPSWFSAAVAETGAQIPEEVLTVVRSFSFKLVMHGAASFEMRICSVLRRHGLGSFKNEGENYDFQNSRTIY